MTRKPAADGETPRSTTNQAIELILFDLGGVLLELGPSPVPKHLLPEGGGFSLAEWFRSDAAIAFEKGLIDSEAFAGALIAELGLEGETAEILDHFSAWPRGLFPGATELLQQLRHNYRLAILTNTNALHWSRFVDELGLTDLVEQVFASHQLALVKPDPAIFQHVAATLALEPGQILFIDDNPSNVAAANELGFIARQVRGFDEMLQTLSQCGILDFR